jgi:hypothetical protein
VSSNDPQAHRQRQGQDRFTKSSQESSKRKQMKNRIRNAMLFIAFILASTTNGYSQQDGLCHRSVFPTGLSVDYGFGQLSVRDEFFSKEKYSGGLPYFKVGWSKYGESNAFQLTLKYCNAKQISSNTFTANVVTFSLDWDYLYPAGSFSAFGKNLYAFLGPYAEFFLMYNQQNFANSGIFLDFSFASLISLGVHPMLIMPVKEGLQLESSLQMNVVSVGLRMPEIVDLNDGSKKESFIKLVTPFGGMNTQWNVGIRYRPFSLLSCKLRYEVGIVRVTQREYLISASDSFIFSLNIHL